LKDKIKNKNNLKKEPRKKIKITKAKSNIKIKSNQMIRDEIEKQ
jgi:hypothetical protein